jgi:hypothetical protein
MNNDERMNALLETVAPHMKAIKDLLEQGMATPVDVLRALYLIQNVKNISRYGKVGFTIKNGEIVSVWQEQQMISEKELLKNLNQLREK